MHPFRSPGRAAALPGALLLGLLLSLLGCTDGIVLEVNVLGRTAEASSLLVSATVNGLAGTPREKEIQGQGDHFVVNLPAATTDSLVLDVQGITDSENLGRGCRVSRGQATVKLDGPGRYPVTVPLAEVPDKGCRLVVELTGVAFGSVTSMPTGWECSKNDGGGGL